MKSKRRWMERSLAVVGLALVTLSGCQTWVPTAGLTLPSPWYLQHPPQYIPQSPPFPLPRESASLNQDAGVAPVGALPAAVPPGGVVPVGP